MTDRELMQMALDALESKYIVNCGAWRVQQDKAIEALRAALANEFNPDWDAMPVMVEEQQRMAKRIEELKERLLQVELNPPTARLAKPEQEPVAWMCPDDPERETAFSWKSGQCVDCGKQRVPVYTAPPQRDDAPAKAVEWQGLTDDEQMQVAWSCGAMSADWLDFARAIEAKLRGKNTLKEKIDDKR